MLKVTVILICYKRFKYLETIIKRWLLQTDDVIVVDNSGSFKTRLPVTVFNMSKNLGPQAKYPFSFLAKYKWVLYVDDDIWPLNGLIKDLYIYRGSKKIISIIGRVFDGSSYYTSTGYRAENITKPIRVDWIGGGCTLTYYKLGSVFVNDCPCVGIDDWWWQRQFKDVELWVVPTKNYAFTLEYKDENALHLKEETRKAREKYYKLWIKDVA